MMIPRVSHNSICRLLTCVCLCGCCARAELVALWDMEGPGAPYVQDAFGLNNGTLRGNPVWVGGKFGKALQFDGVDDYVVIKDHPKFHLSDQITISVWVKVEKFDREWQTIISKGETSWRLARHGTQSFVAFNCGFHLGSWKGLAGKTHIDDGQWHHIAAVNDGQNKFLYIDGVLDATAEVAAKPAIQINDEPIYIGNNPKMPTRFWNGLIDEVAVFSHALSGEEIREICNNGLELFVSSGSSFFRTVVREYEKAVGHFSPEQQVSFLAQKLRQYEERTATSSSASGVYDRTVYAQLLSELARAMNASSFPKEEVADAYKRSLAQGEYCSNVVPALQWLFRNIPTDEYINIIRGLVENDKSFGNMLHYIASDFQSTDDWPAFELFVDAVASRVDDKVLLAESVIRGLGENGRWSNRFLSYCRNHGELVNYVINLESQRAQRLFDSGSFASAGQMFAEIAGLCTTEKEKLVYEFKACQSAFRDGNYRQAIPMLEDFVGKAMSVDVKLTSQALIMKGRANMFVDRQDVAYDDFLEVVVKYPETEHACEANFFIGYSDMLKGDFQKAEDILGSVIKLSPDSLYASKARLCLRRMESMNKSTSSTVQADRN